MLELGVCSDDNSLLPFHPDDTSENQTLVTKPHNHVFYRVLRLHKNGGGGSWSGGDRWAAWHRCVSTTGSLPPRAATHRRIRSPGKATFRKFMLARPISVRQVVPLRGTSAVYLFYGGKVYPRSAEPSDLKALPRRRLMQCRPIWVSPDVDFKDQGPSIEFGFAPRGRDVYDGSSKRSSTACSLRAGGQANPGPSLSAWTLVTTTLTSSPQIPLPLRLTPRCHLSRNYASGQSRESISHPVTSAV